MLSCKEKPKKNSNLLTEQSQQFPSFLQSTMIMLCWLLLQLVHSYDSSIIFFELTEENIKYLTINIPTGTECHIMR